MVVVGAWAVASALAVAVAVVTAATAAGVLLVLPLLMPLLLPPLLPSRRRRRVCRSTQAGRSVSIMVRVIVKNGDGVHARALNTSDLVVAAVVARVQQERVTQA